MCPDVEGGLCWSQILTVNGWLVCVLRAVGFWVWVFKGPGVLESFWGVVVVGCGVENCEETL